MGFTRGFGDKAGRNTANALFNLFGIDFSDRRRVSIDTSRKIKAEARANLDNTRAEIERKNQLYLLDEAVLNNVDQVVEMPLSTEPDALCADLNSLLVQLETNSWGLAIDDEKKIRNKYTNAVFSKFKSGVRQLEIIDPNNPRIDDFQAVIRKARWRKFFGAYWFILFIAAPFLFLIIAAIFDENPYLWSNYWWAFIGVFVIIVGLIIYSVIRRAKKRKERVIAYTLERANKPRAEAPTAAAPGSLSSELYALASKLDIAIPDSDEIVENTRNSPNSEVVRDSIERESPLNTKKGLEKRYATMWEKYSSINSIMGRGFSACDIEKQKDFLVLGFNPQAEISESNSVYFVPISFSGYWGVINKMISSRDLDLRQNAQYLDLFAFRESNQGSAIRDVIQNPALFPYVVEQVCLSQELIETIVMPKVIVIKDKASWAFFGKLPQFTWMGYTFDHFMDSPYGEVCTITGFTTKKDRINKHIVQTALDGTRVLFLDPKEDGAIPTPQFLETLL